MIHFLKKYKWKIIGIFLGGLAGFLYWYFIGCNSGTCPIQSNWHTSALYGGFIGYLFPKSTKSEKKTSGISESAKK